MSSENDTLSQQLAELPEDLIVLAIDASKEKGNAEYKKKNWSGAVTNYSESIAGCLNLQKKAMMLPALYRNRSSALFQMKRIKESLNDAKLSLKFEPNNSKGNYRVGRALIELNQYEESLKYFRLSMCLLMNNNNVTQRSMNLKNEIADISKWLDLAQKRTLENVNQKQQQHNEQKQKNDKVRVSNRYSIDYSRFDDVLNDDDKDNKENDINIEQFQNLTNVKSELNCFNKQQSDQIRELLLLDTRSLNHSFTENTWAAYEGISSILTNKAILQLPHRRLQQRLYPSMLTMWSSAIDQLTSIQQEFSSSSYLVAGFGIGAVLVKVAKTASSLSEVFFTGIDTAQPSLARVLRTVLNTNDVFISNQKDQGVTSDEHEQTSNTVVSILSGTLENAHSNEIISVHSNVTTPKRFDHLILDPENFDDSLIGSRILYGMKHAHEHLLKPNALVLPQACQLYGMIVEVKMYPSKDNVLGLDLSSIADQYCWAPSFESVHLTSCGGEVNADDVGNSKGANWKPLSAPFICWNFNLNDSDAMIGLKDIESHTIITTLIENGRANAIITWFELDLGTNKNGNKISVTTHPSNEQHYWNQAIYWIPSFSTKQGTTTDIVVSRTLTSTSFQVVEDISSRSSPIVDCLISPSLFHRFTSSEQAWSILGHSQTMTSCCDAISDKVNFITKTWRNKEVSVLELQCGLTFGTFSMIAARCGATHVLALDTNSNLLSICKTNAQRNENCLISSASSIPSFSTILPSQLSLSCEIKNDDNDHFNKTMKKFGQLEKPADILIFPLPERGGGGLFEGGLIKLVRNVKKKKTQILSPRIITFPSSITIWALLIDETIDTEVTHIDYSAHYGLLQPRTEGVILNNISHHKLSNPIFIGKVTFGELLHSQFDPSKHFKFNVENIPIIKSGFVTSIVWWWSLDLSEEPSGFLPPQSLSSSFDACSPWNTQGIQDLTEFHCVDQALTTVSLKTDMHENDSRLLFEIKATSFKGEDGENIKDDGANSKESKMFLKMKDPHWSIAWSNLISREQKIEEAISSDASLKQEVVRVSDAIATDSGRFTQHSMPGAHIHPQDAIALAKSLRLP